MHPLLCVTGNVDVQLEILLPVFFATQHDHMSTLGMTGHDRKCCRGLLPEVNLLVLHVFSLLCENRHGVLVEKSHLCSCRQWGCGSNGTEELGSW